MVAHLFESSQRDDSNKCHTIRFGIEIRKLEIMKLQLSVALIHNELWGVKVKDVVFVQRRTGF